MWDDPVGKCDRCQKVVQHSTLQAQMEWAGNALYDTGMLVCPRCLDVPDARNKAQYIGPDPEPVENPRPNDRVR